MLTFKNLSIRRKQTLIIMLTSGIVLLLACAAFSIFEVISFRKGMVEHLSTLAEIVGNNTSAALDFNDSKSAVETLSALQAEPGIIGACIYRKGGEAFAAYDRANDNITFTPPTVHPEGHTFERQRLVLSRPIVHNGETIGVVYLESDMLALSSQLTRYAGIVGLVFLASLLLAFMLSSQLQRLVSDPILQLAQVARSIALEKNYSVRAVKRSSDELGQLIDGFNEMLAQIQERDAALQAARDHLEQRVEERTRELRNENAERRLAEVAVRESQALYHSLVEQLPSGVFRKDAAGRFVFANVSFCRVMELPADQILGKTAAELVAWMSATQATKRPVSEKLGTQGMSHHESIMRTGQQVIVEDEYQGSDGRLSCYHTVKSAVFNADEKIIGTQGILFDITERKRAEGAFRESQALYHSLVDQLPAGVFRKDAAGRFVFVNSWFCRAKAMNANQILSRTAPELAAGEPQTTLSKWRLELATSVHHELILRTGQIIEVEELYSDVAGKVQYLRVVKSPVFDSGGKIVGTQGLLFDITASKEAEAALAYERDLLRALLDNSPDQIYFKDAQSRFLKSSKAQAVNFGVKNADELIGKTDFDFFAEAHARTTFEDEQEIIRTGHPMIGRIEKEVWPDGRECWVIASKMPFRNKDGQIIGTFGISKDITVIKETEAKLEQVHRQLLETSRQAGMAEVATSVLHNVGNVLNSVNVSSTCVADNLRKSKGANLSKVVALLREHETDLAAFLSSDPKGKQIPAYLGQLAGHLASEQSAALKELSGLQKNIEHIKDIVAMQQTYAKVSGVTETLQISELVEDALQMNASALARHKVKVFREYADVPPVTTEKHKVLQVLVNLIRNAKLACDDSGRADKRLTLRVANGGNRVKISISDNGVGIPAENLVRIFNHGFTTRKEGHGFGLHSGALAARELGGSLSVSSDGPGKGAAFTLELPVQQEPGTKLNAL